MEVKKVKAEVVGKKTRKQRIFGKIRIILTNLKIFFAIIIDLIDLLFSQIPILNTLWDFVTFLFLLTVLKNKRLAYFSLSELIIPGIPFIGLIDGFIPIATLLVLFDSQSSRTDIY